MRKRLVGALLAGMCGIVMTACGSGGDSPPTTKDKALATALGYVPKDATTVQFGDATPWLADHGFATTKPAALLNDPKYVRAQPAYQESGLWQYAHAMDGWGWTAADLVWSASATVGQDNPPVHYARFRDDVSLATVQKSLLAHGYKKDGAGFTGPSPAHVADPVAMGVELGVGQHVRLYPDKHLMVGSGGSLPALPSDADSLGAQQQIRTAVAPIGTAYFVTIATGGAACMTPQNLPPAAQQPVSKLGLLPVTTAATAVVSDTKSTAVAVYSSQADAKKDLPHRKALLRGNSPVQNEPYASIAHFSVAQDARTLRYTIGGKPRVVTQMWFSRDAPWAMCAAKVPTGAGST